MAASSGDEFSLEEVFKLFAKFGDSKSSGDAITLSNIDKWLKQAKVVDGKKITTTDTGIYFKQIAKNKRHLNFKEVGTFIETLAKNKKVELTEIQKKLAACGPPGTTGTTHAVKSSAVDRLTDSSKYTGTHKQRFDDGGKGKGKEGREELADNTGYVTGFKNKSNGSPSEEPTTPTATSTEDATTNE
ncbi:hypothetical protein CHUAL_003088 [Chamberlinius hualienensis]